MPKRVSEGLYAETDRLPQYAGKAMKAVEVILESQDKKPVRILDMHGHILTFDDAGRLVQDWNGFWGDYESPSARKANVVDLRPKIDRREWMKRNRWDLTSDHMDMITAAIWPGADSSRDVQSVKGTAPKRPPMTLEGRSALTEINSALSNIRWALEKLSEPALKGLAFEARRISELDREERVLLAAVSELGRIHIQRSQSIMAARWMKAM